MTEPAERRGQRHPDEEAAQVERVTLADADELDLGEAEHQAQHEPAEHEGHGRQRQLRCVQVRQCVHLWQEQHQEADLLQHRVPREDQPGGFDREPQHPAQQERDVADRAAVDGDQAASTPAIGMTLSACRWS